MPVTPVDVHLFWNFRSPYAYLASTRLWFLFDDFHTNLVFHPLPGWNGRSAPERAKKKIPLTRQDVGRHARRYGIPLNPPPITTDPTRAAACALVAMAHGKTREWVVETMATEWADGQDIGQIDVLRGIAERIGVPPDEVEAPADDPSVHKVLQEEHVALKDQLGVMGVPTFVIGEEIFWGNDRIDFVAEPLTELRLRKVR